MNYFTTITAALFIGISSAHADFTSGMLARWTFNDTSSEQAVLTDDVSKITFQKGKCGNDATMSVNADGTITLGDAVFLTADAVSSGSSVFGRLSEGGTIYCRIKYLNSPDIAFSLGLMNSLKPGNWQQMIWNVIYTPKGLAMRAKGPDKLEAGMSSGHLPTKKDDYSDVAIIFNGKMKKIFIYVDGKMAERNTPMTKLDNFQSLMLGRLKESTPQKMQIDEVRIYASPLSAEWIAEIEPVEKK